MPAYRNKDGIWCHRFMAPKNKWGQPKRIYVQCPPEYNTTAMLRQLERDAIDKHMEGRFTTSDTFASYVKEKFLPEYVAAKNLQPATKRNMEYCLEQLSVPVLGRLPLIAVDARAVAGLVAKLQERDMQKRRHGKTRPLSGASVRLIVIWIKCVLRWAARLGDIPKYPEIVVPKNAEFTKPRPYGKEEIQQLFQHVKDDREHALFLLMFDAGLRKGEILGLTWQQIDFEHHTMKIDRQRYRGVDKLQTKSGRSRMLMMSAPLEAALKKLRRPVPPGAHVICEEGGGALSDTWMFKVFQAARKRAELRYVRIHDARHSYATLRTDAGVNPFGLQKLLGHADIRTTQIYVHVPEDKSIPESALDAR